MIRPRSEWLLPPPLETTPTLPGFGAAVATLLARRGLTDALDVQRFLEAGEHDLPPIESLTDVEAGLDRIERAIDAGEPIAIWGDYDADGMTAVAVWVLALRALGVEPVRYLPSRLEEGYGLSVAGLRTLAERGIRLVITCDCGVANRDEVATARQLGMDVVVTDHHVPPGRLPEAVAVIDPHRVDSGYPNRDLTGAGLAFRMARALLDRRGRSAPDLAALAAIGTIADVAPMTGESRAIVRMGLAELAVTTHPGLRALLARAADDPAAPTARDVAFGIVPRLNAAGRIADAELALDLLVERDPKAAGEAAEALEAVHLQRRELTVTATEAARRMAADRPGHGPLALRDDAWPPGLLGLIAGRVSDELARPVAAATRVDAEVRGSVRAPADFHVAAALDACGIHLTKRGGHAAAGGFSAALASWDAFTTAFEDLERPFPAGAGPVVGPNRVDVDLVLTARHVGWPLFEELRRLEPFGAGHGEPVVAVTGMTVGEARRVGAEETHVSFRLRRGLETVDAIAFRSGADRDLPAPGDALDVVGLLEERRFEGQRRLQIRVLDYASSAASPLAERRRSTPQPAGSAA